MSLPHALITSLLEQPGSGLELASRFERSIGYFWSATHQQIYRELARMEAAGWIESAPPESGRGRKKVYCVLPEGEIELKRWVASEEKPTTVRHEFMVRLRAEAIIGPTNLHGEIQARMAKHQERLAEYKGIEERDFSADKLSRKDRIQHVILKTGIYHEENWIEICRLALEALATDPD